MKIYLGATAPGREGEPKKILPIQRRCLSYYSIMFDPGWGQMEILEKIKKTKEEPKDEGQQRRTLIRPGKGKTRARKSGDH